VLVAREPGAPEKSRFLSARRRPGHFAAGAGRHGHSPMVITATVLTAPLTLAASATRRPSTAPAGLSGT